MNMHGGYFGYLFTLKQKLNKIGQQQPVPQHFKNLKNDGTRKWIKKYSKVLIAIWSQKSEFLIEFNKRCVVKLRKGPFSTSR